MDLLPENLFFTTFLILLLAIHRTQADTMVTGTVFCDQCKDGKISLFDYPLNGAKVSLSCSDKNGQMTMSREETSNLFGSYAMRFDGAADLSGCSVHVSGSGEGSMHCGEGGGPVQYPKLMFKMFDIEMYTVDALLAQPPQPMDYCSTSSNPPPLTPPLNSAPPPPPPPSPLTSSPKSPSPPSFKLPPLPALPPLPPLPPLIFPEASACPSQKWTMPEYKCYWRGVNRDTKVAVAFGMVAARRYGTDITLWNGLHGRGDPYRTLLREGVTALLNSYNTLQFSYNPLSVITHMNLALLGGSNRTVLLTALHFMRANSGAGNVTCKFTTCN